MSDFAFTFLDTAPDTALVEIARRSDGVAGTASRLTGDLVSSAKGDGLDSLLGDLTIHRQRVDRGADLAVVAGSASADARRGVSAWASVAPAWPDVLAARADLKDAEQEQLDLPAGATDADAKAAAARVAEAKRRLDTLEHDRRSANGALVGALGRAVGKLPQADRDHGRGFNTVPGTPVPTPPGRGPQQMPGPPSPGPGLRTPAPPATPPTPPTTISGTGPSADTLAQLLSAAARPAAVQPQMPMQQQPQMPMPAMPQVAPAPQPAAAPAPTSRDRKRGAIDEVIDDLLDDDTDVAAPGLAAAAVTAPRPAPAGSIAPPAPAAPAVSGTSADGLTTQSPTSGRPGAAPAGAFAAPATSLSGTTATQATMAGATPGTAPGTHPGTGAPMAGPMGGMPGAGAGGGGGSRDSSTLPKKFSPLGQESLDAAVPYTIARKPRD